MGEAAADYRKTVGVCTVWLKWLSYTLTGHTHTERVFVSSSALSGCWSLFWSHHVWTPVYRFWFSASSTSDDPFFLVAQLNIQWWHVCVNILFAFFRLDDCRMAVLLTCWLYTLKNNLHTFMQNEPKSSVRCALHGISDLFTWLYNNLALYGRLTHSFHTKYLICVSIKIHFIISAGPMRSAALMYFFCLCNHPFTVWCVV